VTPRFSRRNSRSLTGGRRLGFRPRTRRCRWSTRIRSCPLAKTLESLVADGQGAACMWSISRNSRPRRSAQDFTSINVCTREEKAALANALEGFKFSSPYGPDIKNGCGTASGCIMPGCCRNIGRADRAARPEGFVENHLRHGHAGVRHNVPIPHRAVHAVCQVRRPKRPDPERGATFTRLPAGRGQGF